MQFTNIQNKEKKMSLVHFSSHFLVKGEPRECLLTNLWIRCDIQLLPTIIEWLPCQDLYFFFSHSFLDTCPDRCTTINFLWQTIPDNQYQLLMRNPLDIDVQGGGFRILQPGGGGGGGGGGAEGFSQEDPRESGSSGH